MGGRPGPQPKRTYLRWAQVPPGLEEDLPTARTSRRFLEGLDRAGRLIASGPTTRPTGDLLLFRAADATEAERVLRSDPWKDVPGATSVLIEWDPRTLGDGVNLELAPARGSGRLTAVDRVTIVVRDQGKAQRWYEDVLGLRVRDEDHDSGYLELALGRGAVGIVLVAPRPAWGEPYYSEAVGRIGRATGIVFETDSIVALDLRLRHGGARITEAPRPQPWGGATIRFTDPDGNEFLAFQEGGLEPGRRTGENSVPKGPARRNSPNARRNAGAVTNTDKRP
jgi:catechol 2,3-dioxygenase-like lactoylglutathione lyase family enzyme/uncharacterized protein YciI